MVEVTGIHFGPFNCSVNLKPSTKDKRNQSDIVLTSRRYNIHCDIELSFETHPTGDKHAYKGSISIKPNLHFKADSSYSFERLYSFIITATRTDGVKMEYIIMRHGGHLQPSKWSNFVMPVEDGRSKLVNNHCLEFTVEGSITFLPDRHKFSEPVSDALRAQFRRQSSSYHNCVIIRAYCDGSMERYADWTVSKFMIEHSVLAIKAAFCVEGSVEQSTNTYTIRGFQPCIVECFLEAILTGFTKSCDIDHNLQLLILSNQYQVIWIRDRFELYLIDQITTSNAKSIKQLAELHNANLLKSHCENIYNESL